MDLAQVVPALIPSIARDTPVPNMRSWRVHASKSST